MSRWRPCKRSEFVRRLGFDGPFSGTRHQFMLYQQQRLTIPSNQEYSIPQLRQMLKEVQAVLERPITLTEWNDLA